MFDHTRRARYSTPTTAYVRAIEELEAVGFVEMRHEEGRITATILTTVRKFKAWMESHDRRNR
jgi:hypothetical protein